MEEVGDMRRRTFWLTWLLAAVALLLPLADVPGQEVPQPDPVWPFPIYHDRPEQGGLFVEGSFVMYRQTNPLEHQPIAFRGFFDVDGSLTGRPGTVIGPHTPVLFADDAGGPGTYQPGFKTGIGWRFADGISVELSWLHLQKAQYWAVVSGEAPPNFVANRDLSSTFLSSPVFNFPPEFSGPVIDPVALGITRPLLTGQRLTLNTGFGVWNAASVMSIEFDQRFEQVDLTGRVPIFETDCDRCYGLIGARAVWLWERFKWRTVDSGFAPTSDISPSIIVNTATGTVIPDTRIVTTGVTPDQDPFNVGQYTNIVSNRLYGPTIGVGNEWYIGHGVAVSVDAQAALTLDVIKERAKYEPGQKDAGPQAKRSITDWAAVPEVQAGVTLWWYPIEGIQMQVGYDFMAFFNTAAAPNPVSFNFGGLDPAWERRSRLFDGLRAGIAIIF
jgi:hypothetical protein